MLAGLRAAGRSQGRRGGGLLGTVFAGDGLDLSWACWGLPGTAGERHSIALLGTQLAPPSWRLLGATGGCWGPIQVQATPGPSIYQFRCRKDPTAPHHRCRPRGMLQARAVGPRRWRAYPADAGVFRASESTFPTAHIATAPSKPRAVRIHMRTAEVPRLARTAPPSQMAAPHPGNHHFLCL